MYKKIFAKNVNFVNNVVKEFKEKIKLSQIHKKMTSVIGKRLFIDGKSKCTYFYV